jgi:LacI family transcriptional regulator
VPKGRRVTINDVAKDAGVSLSAVSKVLRDVYGVSPQMHAKVTASIERLGYRPHVGARSMRGSSYTIGVMMAQMSSPFQPEIVDAISAALVSTPFQAITVVGGISLEGQKRAVRALVDHQVDGIVLISPWMDQEWLEELGAGLPTVVIARHGDAQAFDTVVVDDYDGARIVVEYLVGLGHKRIVHTSEPAGGLVEPYVLSHTVRCEGYVKTMERIGLQPDVIETLYSEQGGYDATIKALNRPVPPTAIFAGADIAALGALRAAEELGFRVPEDLSIVGFDNIFASTIPRVNLTTVDESGRVTGSTSARLVLERIAGRKEPVRYVITPRLVERSTSRPPRLLSAEGASSRGSAGHDEAA